MIGATTTSGSSSGSPISMTQPTFNNQIPFIPKRCLFCNRDSDDFETNLVHMQTSHGLFIPAKEHLIVELEVLIEYVHLVIHGYHECISCGTQRNSALAAQQHMLGKSHCRIDIAGEQSEFADFWDFSETESNENDSGEEGSTAEDIERRESPEVAVRLDSDSLRLPSGKIISKQSASQQHQRRAEVHKHKQSAAIESTGDTENQSESSINSTALAVSAASSRKSLTKSEKKEQAFSTQLSRLSDKDRQSLMHLPASEQRSILATQQKQAEKAKRAERRYQSRVEGLGNKTLQAHFRPDGPARANG